jgi:hypothetical protein
MEVRAPFLARAGFTIGIATLDEKDKRPRRCSTASFPSHELSQSSRVKNLFLVRSSGELVWTCKASSRASHSSSVAHKHPAGK